MLYDKLAKIITPTGLKWKKKLAMISTVKLQRNSNILILSHFYKRTLAGGGPPQDIRDFFKLKVDNIYYIEHPFPYSDDHRSSLSIYKNGKLEKQFFAFRVFGPQVFLYLLDVIITLYFFIRIKKKFDLCVALDNLNTLSVLPFKKAGLIQKLVFYTIDYTPFRFKNKILNSIYHFIDRIACYNADAIWVVSPRMIYARKNNGVNSKKTAPSISLPIGTNLENIKLLPSNLINRYQIVFVGILLEKQGIQLILESLPRIIQSIPNLKFVIIGQGEYYSELKIQTKKLNIEKFVTFKGFVKDHKEVEKILCKSAVGLAPYVPTPDNFTIYADPGKVKLYVACGLPVVITDVPQIASVIDSKKAGMKVDYTVDSIAKALVQLLSNDTLYKEFRQNAIKLSKNYDMNTLIAKALDKTN